MNAAEREAELASLRHAAELSKLEVPEYVLPTSHHVVLRGMRFHYLDWGTSGRQPILFLHGGGLNAHTYDLVCLALRREYHCVSLDQRGHGDSEWSPVMDYDTATEAEDVVAFVDHLGWRDHVLAGMSMGGLNAIRYSGTHSGDLKALVIIDVGPELQTPGTNRIGQFRAEIKEPAPLEQYLESAVKFNPLRNPDVLRRSLLHNLRRTPDGKYIWKWDPRPRGRGADMEALNRRRLELWADVDRIGCPTLVVRGEKSDVFSEENAAKLTARLKTVRSVVVEGAGHTVQGDNPAGLVREMRRFFGEYRI